MNKFKKFLRTWILMLLYGGIFWILFEFIINHFDKPAGSLSNLIFTLALNGPLYLGALILAFDDPLYKPRRWNLIGRFLSFIYKDFFKKEN